MLNNNFYKMVGTLFGNFTVHPRANLNFYWTFTPDILKTNKMKTLVIIPSLALVLLSSCATQKLGTSTYNDDVYANPKEDRIVDARIAAEKKQAKDAANKRYNDSISAVKQAQKDKDDANPYYKDREFKYDDYYDYEYATRVKRFNNNINGLSYYDNYYTNSYFYNQNPYNYGVSVYNGYSWWGSSYNSYSYNPSVNFYNSWGWGYGNQFNNCYNGYNPYMAGYAAGYNNGFHNGMYGNYYGYGNPYGYGSPFGYNYGYGYGNYGYGYGYGNYGYGYNNGWGYYNSYDKNSSYSYGPRSSHGGGNSRRESNPGLAEKYIKEVSDRQTTAVKFTEIAPTRGNNNNPIRVDNTGTPVGTGGVKQPHTDTPTRSNTTTRTNEPIKANDPIRNNDPIKSNDPIRTNEPIRSNEPIRNEPIRTNEPIRNEPIRSNEPIRNEPIRQTPIRNNEPVKQPIESSPRFETPRQNNNSPAPSFPSNNGGGNAPSNGGGGGGGHRPR